MIPNKKWKTKVQKHWRYFKTKKELNYYNTSRIFDKKYKGKCYVFKYNIKTHRWDNLGYWLVEKDDRYEIKAGYHQNYAHRQKFF